jgi:hypothetical protein
VSDGDNALTPQGVKAAPNAFPGELPVGYNVVTVGKDATSFVMTGLVPGTTYYAVVAAVNAFGASDRVCGPAGSGSCSYDSSGLPSLRVTPPKQVPGTPAQVTVASHSGDSAAVSSLDVKYSAPTSDGGSPVLKYRVELDTTVDFTSPIATEIACPAASLHSVFTVSTYSSAAKGPLVAQYNNGVPAGLPGGRGKFGLTLTYKGASYKIDNIPYDAVPMMADEAGVSFIVPDLNVQSTSGSTIALFGVKAAAVQSYIFPGDRLFFTLTTGGTVQTYANQVFEVQSVSSNSITFFTPLNFLASAFPVSASNPIVINRYYGGRGQYASKLTTHFSRILINTWCYGSDVHCDTASSGLVGPIGADLVPDSGSVQGRILSQLPPGVLTKGVEVSRVGPDTNNGYTWRVTFLDDSPTNDPNNNFKLECLSSGANISPNSFVVSTSGETARCGGSGLGISVVKAQEGNTNLPCEGSFNVPGTVGQTRALVQGTPYFARVFSYNEMGFSLPQLAVGPTGSPQAAKPMVVPGPPTAVSMTVSGPTALQVFFSPPADDGGDAVIGYQVEYSTTPEFSASTTHSKTAQVSGGQQVKTLSNLVQGTFYYVRVSAANGLGYGLTTPASPNAPSPGNTAALNPRTTPDGPTNVLLRVTSQSMITVSWAAPMSNGGDPVQSYIVSWDVTPNIGSGASAGQKGAVTLSAAAYSSYTITQLTVNVQYYVSVTAVNTQGAGAATLSSPSSAAPSLQVPGRPQTIIVAPGAAIGSITVSWQVPLTPWFGVPCSGTLANPNPCPVPVGGSAPESTGGAAVSEYLVEYNEQTDFSGLDGGSLTTGALTTWTLTGLTPGRTFYIRVLARNSQGSGPFCSYPDAGCISTSTSSQLRAIATG